MFLMVTMDAEHRVGQIRNFLALFHNELQLKCPKNGVLDCIGGEGSTLLVFKIAE